MNLFFTGRGACKFNNKCHIKDGQWVNGKCHGNGYFLYKQKGTTREDWNKMRSLETARKYHIGEDRFAGMFVDGLKEGFGIQNAVRGELFGRSWRYSGAFISICSFLTFILCIVYGFRNVVEQ